VGLRERLLEDMKAAMKAGPQGRLRLEVIRLARAALHNEEIDKRRQLTEAEVVEVLRRELKRRQQALPDYERANRPELLSALKEEIRILSEYLPEPPSEEEIRRLAAEVIGRLGVKGPRGLGPVMREMMSRLGGRADGGTVRRIVEEILRDRPAG